MSSIMGPHYSRFSIVRADESAELAYKILSCPCSTDFDYSSCQMKYSDIDSVPNIVVFMIAYVEESMLHYQR